MKTSADSNARPSFDKEMIDIARYVTDHIVISHDAYHTARLSLMDALGCGLLALRYPECNKLLGPIVPGCVVPYGARVPGTQYILDPVQAAFNIGTMIRWLDFNDTWLAAEWGHPSDNLGGILAVADYISRLRVVAGEPPLHMSDVLTGMIKAHEIQGIMSLENSFNRVGLDHVILVKLATAAVVTHLLGGSFEQILNVLSLVWVDGQSLRTYRHAPNTGTRKSWAAGDATSRAVRLAFMAMRGEMGYASALSAPTWGFYDVCFKEKAFTFPRAYGSYVMENVLFKIAYPAEFHAQTAVEAAVHLHLKARERLHEIDHINIQTHESAIRIISKTGALYNPADRDHCLQYMIAIGLIFGELTADHYEENVARNSLIDELRNKMIVTENPQFSKDYLDPSKRSIANSIQIFFKDGSETEQVTVEYPLGHRRRRAEGLPLLQEKFKLNLASRIPNPQADAIFNLCQDHERLLTTPVHKFMELFIV